MTNTTDKLQLHIEVRDDGSAVITNLQQLISRDTTKMASSFTKVDSAMNNFWQNTMKFSIGFQGISAIMNTARNSVSDYISSAIEFDSLMTQTWTLMDEGTENIGKLTDEVLNMAGTLGDLPELARSSFESLSASIGAEKSLQAITEAAKFAKGGYTDVNIAVQVGTDVLGAYEYETEKLIHIYDVLLETNERAKTNIDLLSRTLGNVVGSAHTAGVSFEELNAFIVAATKSGNKTGSVMSALKSTISNIAQPTKEASERADKLGIDFSLAAIKSKGFARFLNELTHAAKGNAQAQADLFGSIEAFNVIASITTETGIRNFNEALKAMEDSTGNTEKAYQKYLQSFEAQWTGAGNKIRAVVVREMLPALKQSAQWINENSEEIAEFAKVAVAGLSDVTATVFEMRGAFATAGKLYLSYWGITKITAWSNAMKKAVDKAFEPNVVRAFGKTFINTNKGVMSSLGNLQNAMKAMPTELKMSIALVGVEMVMNHFDSLMKKGFEIQDSIIGLIQDASRKEIQALRDVQLVRKHGTTQAIELLDELLHKENISSLETGERAQAVSRIMEGYINKLKEELAWKEEVAKISKELGVVTVSQIEQMYRKTDLLVESYTREYYQIKNNKQLKANYYRETTELVEKYERANEKVPESLKKIIEETYTLSASTKELGKAFESLAESYGVLVGEKLSESLKKQEHLIYLWKNHRDVITKNTEGYEKFQKELKELSIQLGDKVSNSLKIVIDSVQKHNTSITNASVAYLDLDTRLELTERILEASSPAWGTATAHMMNYRQEIAYTVIEAAKFIQALYSMSGTIPTMNYEFLKFTNGIMDNRDRTKEWNIDWRDSNEIMEFASAQVDNLGKLLEGLGVNLDGAGGGLLDFSSGILQTVISIKSGNIAGIVAGITGALAGLGAVIEELFGEDWDGKARRAFHGISVVSSEMRDELAQLSEEIGSVDRAFTKLLADNIDEGVTNFQSFQEWTEKVLEQFENISVFGGSTESLQAINDSFEILVKKADELGAHGSAAMISIIEKSRELKGSFSEITKVSEYVMAQLDERTPALEEYLSLDLSEDQYANAVSYIQGYMSSYISEGKNLLEVTEKLGPAIDKILEKGYTSSGVAELLDMRQFAEENSEVLQQITLVKEIISGLGNTGYLKANEAQWKNSQADAVKFYNQLIANSATEQQAMEAILPLLAKQKWFAEQQNLVLEDDVALLIKKAEEQGYNLDAMKTQGEYQQQMNDSLERLVYIMEQFTGISSDGLNIFDELGETVESSMKKAKQGVADFEDKLLGLRPPALTVKVGWDVADFPDTPSPGTGTGGNIGGNDPDFAAADGYEEDLTKPTLIHFNGKTILAGESGPEKLALIPKKKIARPTINHPLMDQTEENKTSSMRIENNFLGQIVIQKEYSINDLARDFGHIMRHNIGGSRTIIERLRDRGN